MLGIFTVLYKQCHYLTAEYFQHLKIITDSLSLTWFLAQTNLCAFFMHLPILDIHSNATIQWMAFRVQLPLFHILLLRFVYVMAYIILHFFLELISPELNAFLPQSNRED